MTKQVPCVRETKDLELMSKVKERFPNQENGGNNDCSALYDNLQNKLLGLLYDKNKDYLLAASQFFFLGLKFAFCCCFISFVQLNCCCISWHCSLHASEAPFMTFILISYIHRIKNKNNQKPQACVLCLTCLQCGLLVCCRDGLGLGVVLAA